MLIGGFCAVMMNVLIRFAAYRMHPFEVPFFRCLFSLFVMLPFIIRAGPSLLTTPKFGFYTLRAVVGLISMLSWFYGITFVPLATATAVNFTAPLFATVAAALVLHEDVRLRRWAAVVIGFAGVLVIMRPSRESMDAMLLLILLSAASSAMNNITVKYLVRTERPNAIVALFSVYLTPLSLIPRCSCGNGRICEPSARWPGSARSAPWPISRWRAPIWRRMPAPAPHTNSFACLMRR